MNKLLKYSVLFSLPLLSFFSCFSQTDTTKKLVTADSLVRASPMIADQAKADSIRKAFSPKKATFRSAVLPGWGQVYNKKYWKLPIVYGALGVSGGIFFYNLKNYKEIRFAYAAKFKAAQAGATAADSVDYFKIQSYLLPFELSDLRRFRDEFRSNIDYSVLAFILLWGLNVVDATVDAHLKAFDVSPDLSLKFKLGPSQMAGTTGFSLVLGIKNKSERSYRYSTRSF